MISYRWYAVRDLGAKYYRPERHLMVLGIDITTRFKYLAGPFVSGERAQDYCDWHNTKILREGQ